MTPAPNETPEAPAPGRAGSAERAEPPSFDALVHAALLGAGMAVWEWSILDDQLGGNDTSVSLLGYSPQDAVHTQADWNRLIHPDDRGENDALYQRHARGEIEVYEHEYRALARDGSWRWLSERGRIVEWTEDGRPARMVGTLADITQRRLAEGRALEMAERLHEIARHVPGIIYQYRSQPGQTGTGAFQYVGDSCIDVLGLPAEALVDDAWAFFRRIDPEDYARVRASTLEAERTMTPWRCDFRVRREDGSVRWLRGAASPQREADGSLLWHGYIQDVSELVELDAARQTAAAEQASNRAKTEFLSRMSHELRTPLNAVLGFAQLMEMDATEPLGPAQKRRVTLIREAGAHLLEMIGELLDLTRIEAGRLELKLDSVPLAPMLAESLEMLRPQADAAGVSLALSLDSEDLAVRADATRLRQVVLNLLSNAVKYNRRGGSVRLLAQVQGDEVVLHVRDTGVGIAPADIESLFEPFQRGAHQRSAIEGTGIGLAITRGLVALMHGRITVCSKAGEGATFSVFLPHA